MCNLLLFTAVLLLFSVFHRGNALFECPVPTNSSLVYFDLQTLNLIAIQQAGTNGTESPLFCKNGKDEECKKQQCCPREVPCCLTEPADQARKCGCKEVDDVTCMYSAPYAILANTECKIDEKTKVTACLREKREHEYTTNEQIVSKAAKKSDRTLVTEVDQAIGLK